MAAEFVAALDCDRSPPLGLGDAHHVRHGGSIIALGRKLRSVVDKRRLRILELLRGRLAIRLDSLCTLLGLPHHTVGMPELAVLHHIACGDGGRKVVARRREDWPLDCPAVAVGLGDDLRRRLRRFQGVFVSESR
ncbi:hypothetical protein D9M68_881340 [compost metagenome]